MQRCHLSGDGILSMDEIRNFYGRFIGVDPKNLDKVTKEGFRAMTAVSANTVMFPKANIYNLLVSRTMTTS